MSHINKVNAHGFEPGDCETTVKLHLEAVDNVLLLKKKVIFK